ncbi:hypothetical protein FB472_0066 [Rhodoglobus vestalii]|uniref:Uncharacterized protein n=1 Tax=Rhodoglobus vestalii TaxID=193384 RepID=A0A8H2PWQ4_9MICO|nr:hypothetical protein FB472_0066 [Rhodoglobus vestalii]
MNISKHATSESLIPSPTSSSEWFARSNSRLGYLVAIVDLATLLTPLIGVRPMAHVSRVA